MNWWETTKRMIFEGPYHLTRRPIPGPGSENIINLTWAVQAQSPINYAIPNHRQWLFQEPLVISNHLIGLTGPGGYQVTYPYEATPLTQIAPTANPEEVITIYG